MARVDERTQHEAILGIKIHSLDPITEAPATEINSVFGVAHPTLSRPTLPSAIVDLQTANVARGPSPLLIAAGVALVVWLVL